MNDQNYQPVCQACDEDGVITLATEERDGDPYCANCAQNRDEKAYEAMLDDFYGGCGAVSMVEHMDAAYRLDRSQK